MATLRDLAPGANQTTLATFAPGTPGMEVADVPFNYAPDNRERERIMERDGMSQTGLAFRSDRISNEANYLANEEAVRRAAGDVAGADTLRQRIGGLQQEAAFWAPKEQKVEDLNWDPSRIADYAAGAVGSMGASMLDPMAVAAGLRGASKVASFVPHPLTQAIGRGGNALSLAGAAVPNFMANAGETYNSMAADEHTMANTTPMERATAAGGAGLVMSALDMIPQAGILKNLGILGGARAKGTILGNTAKGVGGEVITEVGQTGVQLGAHQMIDAGRDSSEDASQFMNAAAQAGFGSGPMHGAGAVANAMRNRVAEPGDPGVVKGDEVNLSTGEKVGAPDFEADLKQRSTPEWQQSVESIRKRQSIFDGSPDGIETDEDMDAFTAARRDILVEELDKAGDEQSKKYADALRNADLSDPVALGDHEAMMDDAAEHVRPTAGYDDESIERAIANLSSQRKNRTLNERTFGGEKNPLNIGGLVDTSTMSPASAATWKHTQERKKEMEERGKYSARLLEQHFTGDPERRAPTKERNAFREIGEQLAAMAVIKKPTDGQTFTAERLGRLTGSIFGERTSEVLKQLAQSTAASGSPLFTSFVKVANVASGKFTKAARQDQEMSRIAAAQKLVDLLPTKARNDLLAKGINVESNSVQELMLDTVEDTLNSDEPKYTLKQVETMFGKDFVESAKELFSQRIEPSGEQQFDLRGTAEEFANQPLSSDDIGTTEEGGIESEGQDFEAKQAAKRAEKSSIDTLIFGKGVKGRGTPLVDALFRNKGRKLPALTLVPDQDGDERKAGRSVLAAMMSDYRKMPGIKRAKEGAKGSVGSSGYDLAPRTLLSLMDDHKITADKRQALLEEYVTQEGAKSGARAPIAEAARNLIDVHKARKLLTALNDRIAGNTPATRKRLTDEFARSSKDVKQLLADLTGQGATRAAAADAALQVKAIREGDAAGVDDNATAAVDAVIKSMLQQMPSDKLVAAAQAVQAYVDGADKRAKALVDVATGGHKKYFGERYVVAATSRDATVNSDSLTMRPHEFREMVDHAKVAKESVRKAALVTAEDGRKVVSQEKLSELTAVEGFVQFEDPANGGEPVVLKASDIVNWVRGSELKADSDGTAKGYDAFIGYLTQGFAELNRQGFVKGLPFIEGRDGEMHEFGRRLTDDELADAYDEKYAELDKNKKLSDTAKDRIAGNHIKRLAKLRGVPAEMHIDGAPAYDQVRGVGSALDDAPLPGKDMSREFALQEKQAEHEYGRNHEYDEQTGQFVAEDDGLNDLDDQESGLKRDVDAKQSLEIFSAITAKTDSSISYTAANASTKAEGVADRWWGMYLKDPKQVFGLLKSLSEAYHAAPMSALFTPARMELFKKDGARNYEAAIALRGRAAGMLLTAQNGLRGKARSAAAGRLGINTYSYEGMIDALTSMARAGFEKENALAEAVGSRHIGRSLARREKAVHAAADKEKITANERKAEKLEARVEELKAEAAKLEAATAPMDAKFAKIEQLGQPTPENGYAGSWTEFGKGDKDVARREAEAKIAIANRATALAAARGEVADRSALRQYRKDQKQLAAVRGEMTALNKEIEALRAKTEVPIYGGPTAAPAAAPARKMVTRQAKPVGTESTPTTQGDAVPIQKSGVQVRESSSTGYAERTKHNADAAGATVAIASDHNTAGEKLTQRVAGSKLFKIDLEGDLTDAGVKLAAHMKKLGTTTLNVAGNGIYTLAKTGWDQQSVNGIVHAIIQEAHAIQPITFIVSGGQTGVDIAGAVAAKALGIPAEITLPAGYKQRDADGVDRTHTRAEIGKQIVNGAAEIVAEEKAEADRIATNRKAAFDKLEAMKAAGAEPLLLIEQQQRIKKLISNEKEQALFDWAINAMKERADKNHKAEAKRSKPEWAKVRDKVMEQLKGMNIGQMARFASSQFAKAEAMGRDSKIYGIVRDEAYAAAKVLHERAPDHSFFKSEQGAEFVRMMAEIDAWEAGVKAEAADRKLNERDFEGKNKPQEAPDRVSQPAPSDEDLKAVQAALTKMLGPNIKVAYNKYLDSAGEWISGTKTVLIGRAAIGSLNNMLSVGYHEGMHAFFSEVLAEQPKVKELLESALNTDAVNQRLKELLAGEDAALAAIERSPEERVAYAFEFWQAGLLGAGPQATGFFSRVQRFLRAVFQGISEQEKAMEIFQALYDGKMAEPSSAARALHKAMTRGDKIKARKEKADAKLQWARTMAVASHRVLTGEDTAVGKEIAYKFFRNPGSTKGGTDPGILNRTRNEMNRRQGALMKIMADLDPGELKHMAKLDNAKTDPATLPEGKVRTALEQLYKFNADMYRYLRDAGLDIGARDDGKYTPMVWDLQYMIENEGKFVAMLTENYGDKMAKAATTMPPIVVKAAKYDDKGKEIQRAETRPATAADAANAIHQMIIDRSGVDMKLDAQRDDGVLTPFFASENTRGLDWITPEHRKEFLSEDLVHKMTGYIRQGVRAAEYTRTWGVGGKLLEAMMERKGDIKGYKPDGTPIVSTTDGELITQLREAAERAKVAEDKREAWVETRFANMKRSVGAMEGVLGKDISDNMRRLNNGAMVYQNLRLLPLSLFAAMLDPNGIMVSGGSLNDALYAYVRGMKAVVKTWMTLAKGGEIGLDRDADETAAITIGSVDSQVFLERMGEAQTSEYIGGTARKINNKFFLLNGLSMWDRSMRIAATKAGMSFIIKHANGHNEHSERFLKDLGLEADDIVVDNKGKLVIDANQLANIYARQAAGAGWADATDEQKKDWVVARRRKAEKDVAKVHAAVNRFVERSILSPNAAQRPAWSSDPHYAALFHLKQYTFSFQETIMQHVAEEAGHGNFTPGLQILAGVPIMIAADVVKGLVTGGGSLPGYMANWNMGDWLMHAWGRAGLNGVGQIGIDAVAQPSTLFGPSVDQLVQTVMHPVDKLSTLDMVPGVRMFRGPVKDITGAVGL